MMNLLFVFTILCIAAENVYASSNHNKDYNVGVLNMGKQSRFQYLRTEDSESDFHYLNENGFSNILTRNKIQNQAESRRNHTGVSSHRKIRDLSRVMITQHFNEKIVAPGDDVQLQCIASSDKPPRFIWDRDGVTISANTDARYTITQMITSSGIKVVSSLNISRVRVEDGGIYSCKAIEAGAEDSHEARLDVYGPPYIRALPPIKVQSGQTLKLRCPYYGYPLSKQEWEHKGKKVQSISLPHHTRFRRSNRRKRQIYEPNENGALLVTKITKEMNGESYTCIVYSPSGEMARRSFEIQVVEAPELDELRVGTGLKEGQIVQITCNIISGDPPIYFSWLKDGKKIPTALKVTERSSELFSVLIIKKVSLEHCGKYSCIATNHVGKTNQTAELFVNVAPKWLEEPKNTSLLLGQRGGVYCNANGYPAPQINWMKKDETLGIWRPVLDLAGGGVMSLANGTLIIEQVSLADEGMYSCHAENNIGNALNKNLWISVNKPVHFESRSLNLTTKIGQTSSFKCQPMGDRPLHVRWLHNGVLLDRSSARLTISESASQNGLTSVVSINHVETRDGGVYECRASNQFGISSFYINLSILEPPTPPLDLQIDSISSRSAKISWRDTIKDHVQFYSVQHTANEFLWDMAFVDNVTRQVSELRQKTELRDLLPATDYRVRVASGNQVDISHYTQPLHFTTQQEAPSSPPLSVQVQVTDSPGEVSVRWLPPPVELSHGVLQGYHVKAVPTVLGPDVDESQTKTVKVVSRLGKHETILSGLLKNTRYEISVSAFNSAGNGPYSTPVSQITREGAPEIAPSGIECRSATSSSLRISWQPIIVHSSSLMGYSVYYSTDDGPWQNISSIHTEIYLQSLLKFTNYSIKIAGYSSYGIGPFSQPITCATLQDVPGPPAAIKVVLASSSSLLATWKKPDFPNGIITHYTVYVKPTSSTSPSQTYKVEPTELDFPSKNMGFEIRNLVEGRQYEVYVSASTRAGEGRPTASVIKEVSDRVVAGVSSLGGLIVGVSGSSVLLVCSTVGSPPPRTVWYKSHDIIVNHPRYTRNHDDSLLINNIDQSLSGNYTCLAKNLYGSDSVSYVVVVQPTPDPPRVRVTPHRNGLHLAWDEPKGGKKMIYTISWKEINEAWQETWTTKSVTLQGVHDYSVEGLKCGTKYSLRLTAANNVGVSTPAFFEASTLGGYPIAPTSTEWFWSNATHILVQTSGWDENSCPIIGWDIDYRRYGSKEWHKVEKIAQFTQQWINPSTQIGTISIADLNPAQWYQIKVVATNSAGDAVSYYNYATTTISGETIGPPSDALDLNMLVIIFSSVLLAICLLLCIYIIVKRQYSEEPFNEYRNSLTAESKSERSNVTVNTPQSVNEANRVYSTPIHLASDAKHELYEISPYAQFAIGFRTFGHVDNQEAPRLPGSSKGRYDSETSFQLRSESEESDCVSRSTTLKGLPKKSCRIPHHNR